MWIKKIQWKNINIKFKNILIIEIIQSKTFRTINTAEFS